MIVLRAVRVEDSGAETELGEVRLTEVGAVFSHSSTPAGQGVVADVVERLRADVPVLRPLAKVRRDTRRDTAHVWFDPERGYIFRDTEDPPA